MTPNTEKDEIDLIDELSKILKSVNKINTKQIIFGGNFNFNSLIESYAGKRIAKMIELKNTLNFAIFGGLEIPKTKDLLFRKIVGLALFNIA